MKRFILLLTLALLVLSFFFYEEVVCALRPHIPFNRSSTHTWSEIGGSQAVKPTIHAIIAADGSDKRHGIIENIVTDYENMERLFRRNVPESQLNLVLMDMDEITPDKILEAVKQINVVPTDTLVFYYSGHAAHDAGNGGQYFQLKDAQGKVQELQRRTLLAALNDKNARLTVLLTDCCNINEKSSDGTKSAPQAIKSPDKISHVFDALFVRPSGIADMTSSKRGEVSLTDSSGQKRGSCFTWPLVALLEKHRDNETITWPKFAAELKTNVQNVFRDQWPDGYGLNDNTVQKTQTVTVYGALPSEKIPFSTRLRDICNLPSASLPSETARPSTANRGPRFGVRAATHHNGVRVEEVLPNGPGAKAGFEIGDIIIEINGVPIRNERDYSKGIDNSPKTMKAKVVNVNDGRTINVICELDY